MYNDKHVTAATVKFSWNLKLTIVLKLTFSYILTTTLKGHESWMIIKLLIIIQIDCSKMLLLISYQQLVN